MNVRTLSSSDVKVLGMLSVILLVTTVSLLIFAPTAYAICGKCTFDGCACTNNQCAGDGIGCGCHGKDCNCKTVCSSTGHLECGGDPNKCGGRVAVGGITIPVDKLGLLAPFIGLASTIIGATVAAAIYVKRVWRKREKQ